MTSTKQKQSKNRKNPEEFEINVQNIVDQIKTKVYFEESKVLEERLNEIQQLFEKYTILDVSKDYPIFRFWPFKPISLLFHKL